MNWIIDELVGSVWRAGIMAGDCVGVWGLGGSLAENMEMRERGIDITQTYIGRAMERVK